MSPPLQSTAISPETVLAPYYQPKQPPLQSTIPYHWRTINPTAEMLYLRDARDVNTHVSKLLGRNAVGLDMEWRPTFAKGAPENPVALIQLANEDAVLLIQVSEMSEFPIKLKEFLESPDIIKAGVGIQNDVKKLWLDKGISTRNCVDLSLLARSVDNATWKGKYSNPIGLARLADTYMERLMAKGIISRSNWEAMLTPSQMDYAGNDAHAGYSLYQILIDKASLIATIKTSYYTFDYIRGRISNTDGSTWTCRNPDYDPGPPPPPRMPRPPKASDVVVIDDTLVQDDGGQSRSRKSDYSGSRLQNLNINKRPYQDYASGSQTASVEASTESATHAQAVESPSSRRPSRNRRRRGTKQVRRGGSVSADPN